MLEPPNVTPAPAKDAEALEFPFHRIVNIAPFITLLVVSMIWRAYLPNWGFGVAEIADACIMGAAS